MKKVVVSCVLLTGLVGYSAPSISTSSLFKPSASICSVSKVETLTVLKADDARTHGKEAQVNTAGLILVPLMPYARQQITPEYGFWFAERSKDYDFCQDLAETIAKDLTVAGVAKKVVCASQPSSGVELVPDGLTLCLQLKKGSWERKMTTYGCSIIGVCLWPIGATVSYGCFQLEFSAEYKDGNNKSVAKADFTTSVPFTEYFYNPGMSGSLFTRLPSAYAQISPQLRAFTVNTLKNVTRE